MLNVNFTPEDHSAAIHQQQIAKNLIAFLGGGDAIAAMPVSEIKAGIKKFYSEDSEWDNGTKCISCLSSENLVSADGETFCSTCAEEESEST